MQSTIETPSNSAGLTIRRRKWRLNPDPSHVICRPHIPGGNPQRIRNIIDRVLSLADRDADALCDRVMLDFSDRHRNLDRILNRHYSLVERYLPPGASPGPAHRTLIGAYFTMEYAVSSTALFNPSMVRHPDQSGLDGDALRFIMSLRAVGEGHISSLTFRSGVIDGAGSVLFDPVSDYVETPTQAINPSYDTALFIRRLRDLGVDTATIDEVFRSAGDRFTLHELQANIDRIQNRPDSASEHIETILGLANANYEVNFNPGHAISERVIFPASGNDSAGIEDARFVRFTDDNGEVTYYATYTAFDGSRILPQLIATRDFLNFRVQTLNGLAVRNKGMALFPRKIQGRYVMLGRQDGENNYIMYSQSLHFWHEAEPLQHPMEPWEYVQVGNCGSPIETEAGWLALTHGVGPMREYAIGAILLDPDRPHKVIAKLKSPLLRPHETEREGYVPNVVYSCGGLIHNGELLIPYAMSDTSSGLVSVDVRELLAAMVAV